ncbi:hypothetical protein P8452_62240 [Trifolium repens]|nr:hypothetical protein P8452_62240 [Trifolium repens]
MTDHVWKKPARGMLKCNVDTACYGEQNFYSVGACIRDKNERFLEAYMTRFNEKPTIAKAEAQGIMDVMLLLCETNRTSPPTVIESDCLQAVLQAIHSRHDNNTEFGAIIGKWRNLLDLNVNYSISYVRRQANRVAHDLAQAPQVFNHCPPCIKPTILNEMH